MIETHYRKGVSKFSSHRVTVIYDYKKGKKLFQFEKISITESGGRRSSNWANFWQVFGGRQVNK